MDSAITFGSARGGHTLGDAETARYLDRLDCRQPTTPDWPTLRALHRAHMCHVPFENLDIFLGRPITLTLEALFEKLVAGGRGGICYELNYLFCALLSALGFEVQLLAARTCDGTSFGRDFDHLLLLVTVERRGFIADVGFGDSFREPLRLYGAASTQMGARYKIACSHGCYTLFQQKDRGPWRAQYRFSLAPQGIAAFDEMCAFHQTSPDSHFTRKTVCSIATDDGRLSMSGNRFITTTRGNRTERLVDTEGEYLALLRRHFGVSLPYAPKLA